MADQATRLGLRFGTFSLRPRPRSDLGPQPIHWLS